MFDNTKIKVRHYPKELKMLIKRDRNAYTAPIEVEEKGNTQFIAHRGLSGIYRENTLLAFKKAGELSYFGIETDVHLTADGKYVIIHDDTTDRISDQKVAVEKSTLAQLAEVKIRPKNGYDTEEGTRIPELFEYIQACKDADKTAVLELKNHFEEKYIAEIIAVIEEIGHLEKTIFISFDWENCVTVRRLQPQQAVQYLTCSICDGLAENLQKNALDIDVYYGELNEKRVKEFHDLGVKINCWTVDTKKDAQKLVAWGVDYITTNILL